MPMSRFKKIIQLELNELSVDIIRELCAEGELPNFKHLLTQWYPRTTTSEEEYELIEPWIQWVTAHTGKAFADHQVFRLGDLSNLQHQQTWEVLSDQGLSCCVIGSMNSTRGSMNKGFFLPDPWGSEEDVYPADLKPLWNFIRLNVQDHNQKVTIFRYAKALASIAKQRLPPVFLAKLAYQVTAQKLTLQPTWKLAALFDEFLFALFEKQLRKEHCFCTLFLNSVAHYQHHYWRNHNQGIFNSEIRSPGIHADDDPVRYGYQVFDELLGRVIKLAHRDTLVVVASGLSQVPYVLKENEGGLCYYRLMNHATFLQALEINFLEVKPLMSRDWLVYFEDDTSAEHYSLILKSLTVDAASLFNVSRHAAHSVFVETRFSSPAGSHTRVHDPIRKKDAMFGDHFALTAIKSGHHRGEGLFFSSAKVFADDTSTDFPLTRLHDLVVKNFSDVASLDKSPTLEKS